MARVELTGLKTISVDHQGRVDNHNSRVYWTEDPHGEQWGR